MEVKGRKSYILCDRWERFRILRIWWIRRIHLSPELLWSSGIYMLGSSSGHVLICLTDSLFPTPEDPPRPSHAYCPPSPATHTSWFTKVCYLLIFTPLQASMVIIKVGLPLTFTIPTPPAALKSSSKIDFTYIKC